MSGLEKLRTLLRKEEGLSTVEYVVLLVLIVGMSVAIWNELGHDVFDSLTDAKGKFNTSVVGETGGDGP